MSVRGYLCVTDQDDLYPDYEHMEIVGETVYHLPFLWLALFRPRDLRVPVTLEPDAPPLLDPLTEVSMALRQLDEAAPRLKAMFGHLGPVDAYCDWLHRAIAPHSKRFVYLESHELGWDDDSYAAHLHYATGVFEHRVPLAVGRKSLLRLSAYDEAMPLPPLHLDADSPRDLLIAQSKIVGGLDIPPP
jgi:hypothetical protein